MDLNFCGTKLSRFLDFLFFAFLFSLLLPQNIPTFSNWSTQLVPFLVAIPGPKNVAPTHSSHIANYDVITF